MRPANEPHGIVMQNSVHAKPIPLEIELENGIAPKVQLKHVPVLVGQEFSDSRIRDHNGASTKAYQSSSSNDV